MVKAFLVVFALAAPACGETLLATIRVTPNDPGGQPPGQCVKVNIQIHSGNFGASREVSPGFVGTTEFPVLEHPSKLTDGIDDAMGLSASTQQGYSYWEGLESDRLEQGCAPDLRGYVVPYVLLVVEEVRCDGDAMALTYRWEFWGHRCPADMNQDGCLNLFDFLTFTNLFNAGDTAADCDESGSLDLFDFLCFVNLFNGGC